jgi:predicted nucleotidyltransferase
MIAEVTSYSAEILSCAQVIARAMTVSEIWLFGSTARRDEHADSDVDLLVILPDDHGHDRPTYDAVLAVSLAGVSVPTDIVVITDSQKHAPPSSIIEDALREGKRIL